MTRHLTDVIRDESQRELLNFIRDTAQKLRDGCALTMAPVPQEHQREACDKIFTWADALLSTVGRDAWNAEQDRIRASYGKRG